MPDTQERLSRRNEVLVDLDLKRMLDTDRDDRHPDADASENPPPPE